MKTRYILISDFLNPSFQDAFKEYFSELGVSVRNWDGLFVEMNTEKDIYAYLCVDEDDAVIGFIQFSLTSLSNWFFSVPMGFIREFWISSEHRGNGYGTKLLSLAESYFCNNRIYKSILTTDTAEAFYQRCGYLLDSDITAKNNDNVFVKCLK